LSVSNGGSATFADFNGAMRWAKASKTVANLFNGSFGDAGVFLALSSFYNCLILALAAVSFAWGVKTLIVFLSEVFAGLAAALPVTVFCGIVVRVLGNFG